MIADAIRKLTKNNDEIYSVVGRVIAVDGDMCDVQPIDGGAIIHDCRLQASMSEKGGVQITPKLDSVVIVTFLEKHTAYCALFSEIESVEWRIEKRTIRFDNNGFSIRHQNETLLSVLSEILDINRNILTLLKSNYNVITSVGLSAGVSPNSIAAIELQNQKIESIKTKLGKILC